MTQEQFENLRDWIDTRIRLLLSISEHPNDGRRCAREQKEIEQADELAATILVDKEHDNDA